MTPTRKYELKARADRMEQTRRRIAEVTVELHRTVGPAATTISEVARRAGVQRATVYNHFVDEAALLSACSAHWRALHPAPDPEPWRIAGGLGDRSRLGLAQLYAWYRETEPMTANVLRDAPIVPALQPILERGLGRYLREVRRILSEPIADAAPQRSRTDAAVHAAVDFHFWQALSPLGDTEAAALGAGLIELAASPSHPTPVDGPEPG